MARSNCLFFALALYRRRKGRGASGYVAIRGSHWGRFPHFLYVEQRSALRMISYVPLDPRHKSLPPPLFVGMVRWGDVCRPDGDGHPPGTA